MPEDTRYVHSACCTWHGPIHETKTSGGNVKVNGVQIHASIPGCPHCGSPLLEQPSRKQWDDAAAKFMAAHPELPRYLEWLESLRSGPCRPLKGWDWRADYARFEQEASRAN